jgi:hypothetical protein
MNDKRRQSVTNVRMRESISLSFQKQGEYFLEDHTLNEI